MCAFVEEIKICSWSRQRREATVGACSQHEHSPLVSGDQKGQEHVERNLKKLLLYVPRGGSANIFSAVSGVADAGVRFGFGFGGPSISCCIIIAHHRRLFCWATWKML